jgi:hypothetical protein
MTLTKLVLIAASTYTSKAALLLTYGERCDRLVAYKCADGL